MKTKTFLIVLFFILTSIQAKAQIVYTDIHPDTTIFVPIVPYNVDSSNHFAFDINNDLINDFRFTARNYYFYWDNPQYGICLLFWKLSNGFVSGGCADGGYREDIFFNDTIDKRLNWNIFKNIRFSVINVGFSCDIPVGDAYFGLMLIENSDTLYGWARCSATNNSITIKDYAYNTLPNMFILAGQKPSGIDNNTLYSKINIDINDNSLEVTFNNYPDPDGSIKIYNNIGQIVKKQAITGVYNRIPLYGISAGLYIIQVETAQETLNKQMYLQIK